MKTSTKLSESTWESIHRFSVHYDVTNAKQALLAFTGAVFNGICTEHYNEDDFQFAQRHLRIVSGLFGILRPLDLIQPYRLEMATALETKKGKNLYEFWGELLTKEVNNDLNLLENPEVINLASNEYFKALFPEKLKGRVVNVAFKESKNGEYKTIAIHAKKARGKMVNFVIKNRLSRAQDLPIFAEDGYVFSKELSSLSNMVFCREH